jgi:hypothetical protein
MAPDAADEAGPDRVPADDNRQVEGSRGSRLTPAAPSTRGELSPRQIEAIREAFVSADAESSRFSLWGLLAVVSGASLILAAGSYFPKPIFAGAVGIATLVSLVALSAMKHPPGVLQVGWWVLLLIYLMAIFSAILG